MAVTVAGERRTTSSSFPASLPSAFRWRGLFSWLSLLLATSSMLLVDARSSVRPERATLRKKSTKDLKKLLREVGATCHKCTEKDDYVERVLDTWEWGPGAASSPDGSIKVDRDSFIKELKASLSEAHNQEREGHEVEDVDPSTLPDLEKVWRDFTERLARGEVQKDASGHVKYELDMPKPEEDSWSRYRLLGMMAINSLVLICLRRLRASERRIKELEAPVANGSKSQSPGIELPDLSGDELVSHSKERHNGGKRGAGKHKNGDKKSQDGARKRHG